MKKGFTLIELLTVISIICVLMALVLSVANFVQGKAARDRAHAEIAALSAAMESYKADNGIYPTAPEQSDPAYPQFDDVLNSTDLLNAKTEEDSNQYEKASSFLFKALGGDLNSNLTHTDDPPGKVYFEFETKKSMLRLTKDKKVLGIVDPWGNFYGYSTIYAKQSQSGTPSGGYNPTFDLWSTANAKSGERNKWVTNW